MWDIYTPYQILTANTINGLCNRLRGIASGLVLARFLGYRLNVFWPIDCNVPVHFLDLFEAPRMIFTRELPQGVEHFGSIPELADPKVKHRPGQQQIGPGVQATIELSFARAEPFIFTTYHNLKPACMPDDEFMRQKRDFLASLRPRPCIQRDIDSVRSFFGPYTAGVHVRGTDTAVFWKDNQLPSHELYFARMDACLAQRPDTMFFVSSDSDEVLESATRRYGSRIISLHTVLKRQRAERRTPEGQVEAVIDLFSLAATDTLIGTCESSFSYEAAAFTGIPFMCISG